MPEADDPDGSTDTHTEAKLYFVVRGAIFVADLRTRKVKLSEAKTSKSDDERQVYHVR